MEEVGGLDCGVVPGNVVIAEVVRQDQEDVGAALSLSCQPIFVQSNIG